MRIGLAYEVSKVFLYSASLIIDITANEASLLFIVSETMDNGKSANHEHGLQFY